MSEHTRQPEKQQNSNRPAVKLPDTRYLACPKFYCAVVEMNIQGLFLNRNHSGVEYHAKTIRNLQEEISTDQARVSGLYMRDIQTLDEEDCKTILRVLENYSQQWVHADSIITEMPRDTSSGYAGVFDVRAYKREAVLAKSYIEYLVATIPRQSNLEEAFFNSINMNTGKGFRIPTATTYDARGNQQGKWAESLEKRYEIGNGAVEAHHNLYGDSPKKEAAALVPVENEQLSKQVAGKDTIFKKQSNLSKQLAGKQNYKPTLAWCPVLKDFIPKDKGCAAHIVPHAWGYKLAKALFDDHDKGENIIWNERNGIWMARKVEEAFDHAQIIIVPVDTENPDFDVETYELKLMVLDRTLLSGNRGKEIMSWLQPDGGRKAYYWKDIDEKTLEFRTVTKRPAKRYLFFNYLNTTTRIATQHPTEWEYGLQKLNQLGKSWATPGSYLTRGLIQKFEERAKGCTTHITLNDSILPTIDPAEENEGVRMVKALLDNGYESGYESAKDEANFL